MIEEVKIAAALIFILLLLLIIIIYCLWKRLPGYPPSSCPRVLAYHKITNFEFGGTWMTPGRFRNQVDALMEVGYRFIGEETLLRIAGGERNPGEKEIFLTFDDGYAELLDTAVPLLMERKIPAHFFIVTSYVGQENKWELPLPGRRFRHLSWEEIEQLCREGFTMGSHTCSHSDLTRLPPEAVKRELRRSRQEIEEHLGVRVRTVSFPFGRVDPGVKEQARAAGYSAAFTLYPGRRDGYSDRFALRREGVYIIDTIHTIRVKLGRGRFFWLEDLKGRAINAVAVMTPLLKDNYN